MTSRLSKARQLRERFERDAMEEDVPPRIARRLFWVPIVGGLAFVAMVPFEAPFRWFLDEDHLAEWIQFGFCLVIVGLFGLTAAALWRRHQKLAAGACLLLALGFLMIAGEEISWGQRVIGFGTPPALEKVNSQTEFNFHNIVGAIDMESTFKFAQMVGSVVLIALTVRTRLGTTRRGRRLWRELSPPVFLLPYFLIVVAYRLVRYAYQVEQPRLIHYQEWVELCLYSAIAIAVLLCYRRYVQASRTPLSPGQGRSRAGGRGPVIAGQTSASRLAWAPTEVVLLTAAAFVFAAVLALLTAV